MKRRAGTTIAEVVFAMTIAIALVGVLAAALSRLIESNTASREHLQTVVTLGRLGEQFRRDAHAASAAVVEQSDDMPARLTLEGETPVEYAITPEGLTRIAKVAGKAPRRERFVLPGMKFLGWSTGGDGREIALRIGRLARPRSEASTLAGRFSIAALLANNTLSAAGDESGVE